MEAQELRVNDCALLLSRIAGMDGYTGFKLSYFGITGLGECIRQAMALTGTPFDDDKQTGETWGALKATLPAGTQMPLFQMTPKDGGEPVTLSQSRAILRFVGSATYDGKSLYPEDPQERYWCDEVREKERQTGNREGRETDRQAIEDTQ